MRVAPAFLAFFAACSPALPAGDPAWSSVVAGPVRREASIDVVPAELGDPAAVGRMRHRVRMKRIGRAWLRLDGPPFNDSSGPDDGDPIDHLLPVIGETANRIRVVTEEDGARVAVWLDRRDAWESVVAPVQLEGDAAGARPGGGAATGVWLEAGAPISVARVRVRGVRSVELRDDGVEIRGTAPAAYLGHVWIVPHDDRTETDMDGNCPSQRWETPADRRLVTLVKGAVIRAAAGEAAPALATAREELDVALLARDAGWALVELRRPYARVRGHVPARSLAPFEGLRGFGSGCGGGGFGMSHADRIDVPAGACLFDRESGDVVGVATETQTRLGARERGGDEWPMVYVRTRWEIASLYVHDTGSDPARPALESCAPGRHRR